MIVIPGHVPWPVHRIAVSDYHESLHVILARWSLADVVDANLVLDGLDAARRKAQEK